MTCPEHPRMVMEFVQARVPGAQALHQRVWYCRWCDRHWAYSDEDGVEFRRLPERWRP